MSYANYVGRIGALAVALGIGTAVAGTAGQAMAETDSASSPAGESGPGTGAAPAAKSDSPATEPKPAVTTNDSPSAADAPAKPSAKPRTNRQARCTTCRDRGTTTAKAPTAPTAPSTESSAAAVPAALPTTVVAPKPVPVVAKQLALLRQAVLGLFGVQSAADKTPAAPADSAADLVMLAAARRQTTAAATAQSVVVTPLIAAAAPVNTAPTAAPTQSTPDQTTGVVTGLIGGADAESNVLTYTVTGSAPNKGKVSVNASTGAYTYTPTQAARLAADITSGPDTDSFTVQVNDGTAATTVTVSVPVLPAALASGGGNTVGTYPTGVAVSATKIYVTNAGSNTVSVIDRVTGATVTVGVVGSPKAITLSPDGTRAYVGGNNAVSVLNTATNTVVSKVTLSGGQIYGIEFAPNGQRAYIANSGNNTVSVLSTTTATPTVVATIAVGSQPRGVAVSADGTRLYVTNWNAKSVSVIDIATNKVVGSPITVGTNPFGIDVSADGTRVYVSNFGSGTVSVLNPTAATRLVATIAVGAQPMGAILSPDGSVLYVANGRDTVSVIATATNAVVNTIAIDSAAENGSHRIALSPDGQQMYVTDMADRTVRTLNLVRGNTAPIAGTPTVGIPDTGTGKVTGALNVTDPDGDKLSYTVTQPSGGTVTVDAAGNFTFTPTPASGAALARAANTVSFSVAVGDGKASTTTTVTVPMAPAQGPVVVDSTAALQAMFDKLKAGDTLTLENKTYQHSGVLYIRVAGVTINGNGATLAATNDATSSVQILADNVTLSNLTLTAPLTGPRYYAPEQHSLVVMGDHATVNDVNVIGAAGSGVFIYGAGYFELNNVSVTRSRADGIHMTNGAHDGVLNNVRTEWTGDDGIAVVSYANDKAMSRNITINSPTVAGTTWGRGISVVGGQNITYRNITVSDTNAAGVYIATESTYNTRAVSGVTIDGGTITNADTNPAIVHGAVLVYAGNPGSGVSAVTVKGLTIVNTPATAGWVLGVLRDGGIAVSGIVFDTITIRQNTSLSGGHTNAPAGAATLKRVTVNGVALTSL